MGIDDLINEMNQQYEEVDSKSEIKEEKINIDEILKTNEITEQWLDEVREHKENSKDDDFSKNAFKRSYAKPNDESKVKKEDKKEKKSSWYEKSSNSSSYSSSYSSSTSKKSSDEIFYEKVEKAFNDKVIGIVDDLANKYLNRVEENLDWDILDLQYELNKKRINDRDYQNEVITVDFNKCMENKSNSCSRKVDIAEILLLLKINPNSF